jgi:hypothetical protein
VLLLGAAGLAIVAMVATRPAAPIHLPADAGAGPPTERAEPTIVAPVALDAGAPVDAPTKPATRRHARPPVPRCDDDPYACP